VQVVSWTQHSSNMRFVNPRVLLAFVSNIIVKNAFNITLGLTKAERIQVNESSMTHAMVISGVHLDVKTGKPVRYKVENSWGEARGDKGYFVMTDAWFEQCVHHIWVLV
jgi:bleomycin hydrolase